MAKRDRGVARDGGAVNAPRVSEWRRRRPQQGRSGRSRLSGCARPGEPRRSSLREWASESSESAWHLKDDTASKRRRAVQADQGAADLGSLLLRENNREEGRVSAGEARQSEPLAHDVYLSRSAATDGGRRVRRTTLTFLTVHDEHRALTGDHVFAVRKGCVESTVRSHVQVPRVRRSGDRDSPGHRTAISVNGQQQPAGDVADGRRYRLSIRGDASTRDGQEHRRHRNKSDRRVHKRTLAAVACSPHLADTLKR